MSVFDKVLRAGEGRLLRKLVGIADQINIIEDEFVAKSDAELRAMTAEFKQRLAEDGETLDYILAEAFATVREAARRTLGQRAFDVQLMGGAALHLGNIAEMRTGEGKTLTGVFPAYLNALSGDGVHVVTTNDYLARRDSEWMGRVHRFLGLEVGVILTSQSPEDRRHAYGCDITYGTNNEFGFDYLRDNMAWSSTELVQRGHNFAIVDEVDSILIDEARTPLIISGPAEHSPKWYGEFAKIAARLTRDVDYECDEGKRTLSVNESAIEHVEDMLGIENLYEAVNTPLVGYLNNALKAKELFARDKDYVVMNGEVMIVDEFTGRILAGRRYNEGMHQAIEAKENVEIKQENQTLATITLQNYFRLYNKLGGMTGTAQTEAAEFEQVYKLGCVTIPTNRDMVRIDSADVVFKTEEAKWTAVVDDIVERHEKGQPVLVGTTSVEKSEHLSGLLLRSGIPHEVLNAKYHDKEAAIIAEAGRRGAVTVATNMAGRGTDIMLGGNSETRAAAELEARGLSPVETPEDYEAAWPSAIEKAKSSVAAEHDEVTGLGGLYVLGTERHESRRIDNQLRGRSGRQGDPGESRFYLSLGDDLMRLFNAHMVETIMDRLNLPEDIPIESKMVSRSIRSAQTQIEQQNFEIRKNVLKYDEVLNKQRTVIYDERRRVLMGEDLHEQIRLFINDVITDYVHAATEDGYAEDWDLTALWNNLRQIYPVGLPLPAPDEHGDLHIDVDDLVDDLIEDAQSAYDRREAELGAGPDDEPVMRELERQIVLSVLDRKWREHLYEMDYLQEGISLRSYGQRDPLVEYQREAFEMFGAMMEAIKEESVGFLFNVEVPTAEEQAAAAAAQAAEQAEIEQLEANLLLEQAPGGATPTPAATIEGPPAEPELPPVPASADPAEALSERSVADILGDAIGQPKRPAALQYSAPSVDGEAGVVRSSGTGPEPAGQSFANASRNQPCPCGSGRKFKRCHGAPPSGV